MPVELPIPWIIALNVLGWPVIQVGISILCQRLPQNWLRAERSLFRTRRWESGGAAYARWAGVRHWKHLLPDGAPWLRGFAKKRLVSSNASYLDAFIVETCRGEAAHWLMLAATPIFFLWNPLWADLVMCVYAVTTNIPCILTQRYNRIRLLRALAAGKTRAHAGSA